MTSMRSATAWQDRWLDRFYRSHAGWTDGTTEFHELCAQGIPANGTILEVGAGPKNDTSAFLSTLAELHGVDVSDEVRGNPHLRSHAVVRDEHYPFSSGSFDLVVSNYVVEHVQDPDGHLAEIHRVLKPRGRYVFRTPNLFHYVAVVSRFTPYATHRTWANRLRNLAPLHHDPWPTVYAMNTPASVRAHAGRHGFAVEHLDLVEKEPCYGLFARPLFLAFLAYERVVNASDALAWLRANMFVTLRKQGE